MHHQEQKKHKLFCKTQVNKQLYWPFYKRIHQLPKKSPLSPAIWQAGRSTWAASDYVLDVMGSFRAQRELNVCRSTSFSASSPTSYPPMLVAPISPSQKMPSLFPNRPTEAQGLNVSLSPFINTVSLPLRDRQPPGKQTYLHGARPCCSFGRIINQMHRKPPGPKSTDVKFITLLCSCQWRLVSSFLLKMQEENTSVCLFLQFV